MDRPNVLLVVFDTARADGFEPYGAPAGASPVVADLARRGAAFPMAIATSAWTLPSHASIFTGLLPRAFGFTPGSRWETPHIATRLPALFRAHRDRVLAEVMRRAGYGTFAVSSNQLIRSEHGLGVGFDGFQMTKNRRAIRLQRLRDERASLHGLAPRRRARMARELARWWKADGDNGAERAERILRGWLDRGPARPFFGFVNLMETHMPYFPPKPYNDLGAVARWRAVHDLVRYESRFEIVLTCMGEMDVPENALERMRHLYARSVRYLDDWLGGLLEGLDRRGLLDDTLVIVMSDHGEAIGENHLIAHGWSVDQRHVHVPFVVAGPGAPLPRPVESIASVPRMIATAAGVADHPFADDTLPGGAAIAQKDVSFEGGEDFMEAVRASHVAEDAVVRFMERSLTCAVDGAFKLVRVDGRDRLYDLVNDPLETADVSEAHPDRARALAAALDSGNARTAAVAVADDDRSELSAEQAAAIEAQLEGLGYI